jgi:alkanesulfonate monooxygenase SsuD/methylene tetrahydromethanopterin reductase-like flavin-dependent oxidoreductase (luciferase family)
MNVRTRLEVHDLRLKFGIHLPIHGSYDYKAFLEASIAADRLGFDYVTVGDHFFLPTDLYIKVGGDPSRPDKLDAWTALAAVAAKTEKIKMGTRVSPIPFYLPSRLAKIVTTVDIISRGRTFLGVGAAWHKEEAVSYGIRWGSHRERIERMLEGLRIILSLWSQEKATFEGKYYQVREAPFWPKPVQKPHPPVWFGGSSDDILRATARYGEGLFPLTDMQPDKLEELHRRLVDLGRQCNREKPPILAPAISYPDGLGRKKTEWISRVESQVEIGAGLVLIDFSTGNAPPKEAEAFLEDFAREVLPSFQ